MSEQSLLGSLVRDLEALGTPLETIDSSDGLGEENGEHERKRTKKSKKKKKNEPRATPWTARNSHYIVRILSNIKQQAR